MRSYLLLNAKSETDVDAKAAKVEEALARLAGQGSIPTTTFKLHIARDVWNENFARLGSLASWVDWVLSKDQFTYDWRFHSFVCLGTKLGAINQQFATRALASQRKVAVFDLASGQFQFARRIVRLTGSYVDGWEAELS